MTNGLLANGPEPADYERLSRERLTGYEPRRLHAPDLMPAAVLLLLTRPTNAPGDERVLLTVRTHTVEHHKGQISFPGGAVHAADADLQTTALRETWEEVGVEPEDVEVIGQLDDMVTISDFVVTPFVGVLQKNPYEYLPSPVEVGEVIEPPMSHLLEPETLVWEKRQVGDRNLASPAYWYGEHRIWGATARMLHEFLCLLRGDVEALEAVRRERRR